MAALDRMQLWNSIASASGISRSITSRNLRALASAFKKNLEMSGQTMDPPDTVTVEPMIEAETGKLVTKVG